MNALAANARDLIEVSVAMEDLQFVILGAGCDEDVRGGGCDPALRHIRANSQATSQIAGGVGTFSIVDSISRRTRCSSAPWAPFHSSRRTRSQSTARPSWVAARTDARTSGSPLRRKVSIQAEVSTRARRRVMIKSPRASGEALPGS